MSVKITGKQLKEFYDYVTTPAFHDYAWVPYDYITGTINGRVPTPNDGEEWEYTNIGDDDIVVIQGGVIKFGKDEPHGTSDIVPALKKHFCKL